MPNTSRQLSLYLAAAFCLALAEPALADRLATIGSGVSGDSMEKAKLFKFASLGMGGIFVLLGLLSMFPLFRGHSNLKSPEINLKVSGTLVAIGAVLISIYFI